jgi:hypothetical protein
VRPDPLRFWCQYGTDPCRSMVVAWVEEETAYTDTTAYWRRPGTPWREVTGSSAACFGTGGGGDEFPAMLRHRVIVTGLQPGVTYEFRFTPFGETFRLRTLPDQPVDPVVAIYSSDTWPGAGGEAAYDPEYVTSFGDVIQNNGALVFPGEALRQFALQLRGVNNRLIPMVLACGNHDSTAGGGNAPTLQLFFWWNGNNNGTTGLWYEVRAGDWLSLIVLDSEHNNSGPLTGSTNQEVWYHARLAEGGTIRHRQMACHVPGFPGFRYYLSDPETRVRQFFYMPAEQAGVRIGFGGHDHTYLRTFRMLHDQDVVPAIVDDDAPLGARWWNLAQGTRELQPDLWYAEEATNVEPRASSIARVTFTMDAQTVESIDGNGQVFHTFVEPANPLTPRLTHRSGWDDEAGWVEMNRWERRGSSWQTVTSMR